MNSKIKYLSLALLAGCILAGFWIFYIFPLNGYQETIVSSGQETFTAEFSHVTAVIPCNNDPELEQLLDDIPIRLSLQITDADGAIVGSIMSEEGSIHTNSYISTELFQEDGVPFDLIPGQVYFIQYHASCGSTNLNDLSFSLCGSSHRTWGIAGAAVVLCLAVILICAAAIASRSRESAGTKMMLIGFFLWLSATGLYLISAPKTEQSVEERTRFANAYAISSVIMNRPCADADGNVYIEEEGIRNLGNLSYSVPLNRFWSNWHYGNRRTSYKTSSLFRTNLPITAENDEMENQIDSTQASSADGRDSDGRISAEVAYTGINRDFSVSLWTGGVVVLLYGLAIAATRALYLPYQLILLSGSIVSALLVLLLYMISLKLIPNKRLKASIASTTLSSISYDLTVVLVTMIFLMPSVIQAALSYSGDGIRIGLGTLFGILCLRDIFLTDELESSWNQAGSFNNMVSIEGTAVRTTHKSAASMGIWYWITAAFLLLTAPYYLVMGFMVKRDSRCKGRIAAYAGSLVAVLHIIVPGNVHIFSDAFNTLTAGGSALFSGIASGPYYGAQNIQLSIYCLIIIYIAFWILWMNQFQADSETPDGSVVHSEKGTEINKTAFLILITGDLLYILYGTAGQYDMNTKIIAVSGLNGAAFLPFSLIPLMRRKTPAFSNRTASSLIRKGAWIGIAAILLFGLKCIS